MKQQDILDQLDDLHRATMATADQIAKLIRAVLEVDQPPTTVGDMRKQTCVDCGAAAWPHPYRHPVKLLGRGIGTVSRSQLKIPLDND